ncbi:hypothetical protein Hanom_Chr01g00041181 [Helianthus anomalus]
MGGKCRLCHRPTPSQWQKQPAGSFNHFVERNLPYGTTSSEFQALFCTFLSLIKCFVCHNHLALN